MVYKIIEDEIDLAGFHRVRVVISPDETVFLKYKETPTQKQVDAEIVKILEARAEQKAEEDINVILNRIPMI